MTTAVKKQNTGSVTREDAPQHVMTTAMTSGMRTAVLAVMRTVMRKDGGRSVTVAATTTAAVRIAPGVARSAV
jgi:hypothetical protein